MAGRRITDLPRPNDANRIDLHASAFESEQDAAREDALRAKSARVQAGKHGGEWGGRAADLAHTIDPELRAELPVTLASSRYLRDQRARIFSDLYRLLKDAQPGSFIRADVVKPSWACDVFELQELNPNQLLGEFRADLLRVAQANPKNSASSAQVGRRGGFLFAAIHGEFDQIAKIYHPHVHIGATGSYIDIVDGLRTLKGYRPSDRVRFPIYVNRTITDLPSALTYILKSYWPQRPFLPLGAHGAIKRPRNHQRIDEPYHTDLLLWLDEWKLSDLVLLMGIRVGKKGLVIT